MVFSVYEDQAGSIWAGTYTGGLNLLDPATGSITRFVHDPQDPSSLSNNIIRAILEDSQGRLWLATDGGLNLFDRASGTFTRPHATRRLSR